MNLDKLSHRTDYFYSNFVLIKVGGGKPHAHIMGKKRVKEVKKKSKSSQIKINPFEVRINKRKYSVLGQKREKGERGLPGISRSRALEKVYTSS